MGVFGFAKVSIEFKGSVPSTFMSQDILERELSNIHGDAEFNIIDYEIYGNLVEFEMNSGRLPHLDFQVNALFDLCRTHQFELIEFNSSGYQESDSGSLFYSEGDDWS